MGGPGGMRMFGDAAAPGEVLPAAAAGHAATDRSQKKQLAELQKEVDGKLEKVLTEEQRNSSRRCARAWPTGPPAASARPAGFLAGQVARADPGGPGGPGGPGRPGWPRAGSAWVAAA